MSQEELKFSEIPVFIRIKLSERGKEEFWHRIDEFGGIKNFCENFDYSTSKVYNLKNKDSYIPIELIKSVFGNETAGEVIALKGKGRSRPLKKPEFPIKVDNELLTRIQTSVNVNSNGIPIYQSNDEGNVRRFIQLLERIGNTPYELYNRSVYELRYPKYLHKILSEIQYEEDFGALIDEKGEIKDQKLIAGNKEKKVEDYEGKLFSRQKRYEFYLARGDSQKLRELISEEASRVGSMIGD